jgi:hypothetical protein
MVSRSLPRNQDQYIAIPEKALDGMAKAASLGASLADLIPIHESFLFWVHLLILFCSQIRPCAICGLLGISLFIREWFPGHPSNATWHANGAMQ